MTRIIVSPHSVQDSIHAILARENVTSDLRNAPGYLGFIICFIQVASDLGLGGGFARHSGFLHYLQLASQELATIGMNVTKNEIPKSKFCFIPKVSV